MVTLMAVDGYSMSYGIGSSIASDDLTSWDNGQAALIDTDLSALDWFIGANITHTKPKTDKQNPVPRTHYPRRLPLGRIRGKLSTRHHLQTGILTYAAMGKCVTTEASPNIHEITKGTTVKPIWLAFHYEKEGDNASRRKDILGIVPTGLDISVSEENPAARQTYNCMFAYTGAGSDIAAKTQFTQATHKPYDWYNYKAAAGASAFTYNSGAINADIVSIDMHIGWSGNLFGPFDGEGYPTDAHLNPPFDSYVDVGIRVTDASDTVLDVISDLIHTNYAGDLDLIVDFYESANRYLKYTWDKMWIDPESYEELFQEEGDWFDGIKFRMEFLDENSSLAVQEKNALNNDYYENVT